MELGKAIEGILFYRGEPVSYKELATFLKVSIDELKGGLVALRTALEGRGVTLVETETDVSLRTSPDMSPIIETLRREEMKRDIGRAGAETLAIILYRGPISRSEIDYIRGVNSSFILRNLLIRGLIEREPNPNDQRTFRYSASNELLAHLGVTKRDELPEYETILAELDRFDREREQIENDAVTTES